MVILDTGRIVERRVRIYEKVSILIFKSKGLYFRSIISDKG